MSGGTEMVRGNVSKGARKNHELDQSRDLRAPRMNSNLCTAKYLQQRNSLHRVGGDGNDHRGGQGSRVATPSACAVDE